MHEHEEGDKELLGRLIDIICGDKMVGIEAELLALKGDALKWREAQAAAGLWQDVATDQAWRTAHLVRALHAARLVLENPSSESAKTDALAIVNEALSKS